MSKKISIFLISFLIIMVGFWVWTIVTPKNSIVIGGSTSVNPFMQLATKEYSDSKEGLDFVYNSTGSQAGVGGVEKGMYAAGFISKDATNKTLSEGNSFVDLEKTEIEDENAFENIKTNLEDKKNLDKQSSYLTITFALDAIGIIFNSPSYWQQKINNISINDLVNFNLKDNNSLLAKLYEGELTWYEMANRLLMDYTNDVDIDNLKKLNESNTEIGNIKIPTYTREDGSGTRSAFSDLTKIKKMPSSNVVNSNGAMIEQIKVSTGFGYISNGFIQNLDNNGGIFLSGIDNKKLASPLTEGEQPYKFDQDKKQWVIIDDYINNDEFIKADDDKGYTFKRPFICITNLNSNDFNNIFNFFNYLYKANDDSNPFKKEGLVKYFVINDIKA
ncbi:phosphate ABC transporter substrate-binding protein [Spiroplasma turonicum]|uniref:Phosphate ABC transporter substrate-binding protein n=1 Tax=Spiroplasma turonicum TaxID=216946 RepID=A0A0K1P5I4_9MOLU|nr:phosphate ABC transporter substrate-binding protein [Spiroplasma turonicum]AKU79439.1 phosphate ABC transporter substrate-binding protein [Spiroplasma turonicum]ALX70461.1 phosphate ABC transporter substrate-binding protein [Spiroplasma turonicum]